MEEQAKDKSTLKRKEAKMASAYCKEYIDQLARNASRSIKLLTFFPHYLYFYNLKGVKI